MLIFRKKNNLIRCTNTNEAFNRVYISFILDLVISILPELTKYISLRDYTRKIRNKGIKYIQTHEKDFQLSLQSTLNGFIFLQFDSGIHSDSRSVIFYLNEFKSYIRDLKVVVVDGNFRSSPNQFYQLITIQEYIFGKFLPLIYYFKKNQNKNIQKYFPILNIMPTLIQNCCKGL
ncbi:hypothetical protein DMUE_1185 [Dictyocoela muelleri]|nr:hypothetical protein DMUE_1185 [Dictyocoela muelleri]